MSHDVAVITTPRLLLRPFRPTDSADIHRLLYSDPDVMRFIPGGVRPPESADRSMTYFLNHWHEHSYGAWAVIHRADNAFIAQGGLNRLSDGAVEVFYTLAMAYWGQGGMLPRSPAPPSLTALRVWRSLKSSA
jgi:ribosomal-protein-alanine N-acetyltransferase